MSSEFDTTPSEPTVSTSATLQATFAEVVEPEIEVMLRVARSITGSAVDAEDLVQESLIRAYRALDRFDGRHPRAWLLTIVRNTYLNMQRRQRPLVIDDEELLRAARPAFSAPQTPAAEDVVTSRFLDAEMVAAIRALDEKFRSALLLVDVHDLTYAEAASVLGVPVGTVMSRLSRARARMRRALAPTLTRNSQEGDQP